MKKFDHDKPFSLVIKITKGDIKGEALSMMANGIQVGFKTEQEAMEVAIKFIKCANIIPDEYSCYGIISVVSEGGDAARVCQTQLF